MDVDDAGGAESDGHRRGPERGALPGGAAGEPEGRGEDGGSAVGGGVGAVSRTAGRGRPADSTTTAAVVLVPPMSTARTGGTSARCSGVVLMVVVPW
ncbi:hypothetical protein [Kitasatospora fiedleri]|uniref:hypothetical protein n=1 Tax=Kitasatospora fiedleri TaxID=2991545 RepID=UPI00249B7A14|nr:hypothetical protein [Kitasatospora fiedleri]